jgi:hypothetical protein
MRDQVTHASAIRVNVNTNPTPRVHSWPAHTTGNSPTMTGQVMGHKNIDRVLLAQPPLDLPPRTAWVLLLMAKAAHDETGHYWRGQTWLAVTMGYKPGPDGRRAIRRHLAILTDAGLVKRLPDSVGRNGVYQLTLPGLLGKPRASQTEG